MSKLLEDPKVAVLVEKTSAAAVKAETKRVLGLIADAVADNKDHENKGEKNYANGLLGDLKKAVKAGE